MQLHQKPCVCRGGRQLPFQPVQPTQARLPQQRRGRAAPASAEAAEQGGLAGGVQRVARRVQAALPIVGLFSRLTATSGGVGSDALSYPEYCRKLIDAAPAGFDQAVAEFERRYGKEGSRRNVLLCLWMAGDTPGLLPGRSVILAARRLRVTFDIEIEMDRFQGARDEALKQFDIMARPPPPLKECLALAVDSLCTIGPGLPDGALLDDDLAALLASIVVGAFANVGANEELARQAIEERPSRAKTYVV